MFTHSLSFFFQPECFLFRFMLLTFKGLLITDISNSLQNLIGNLVIQSSESNFHQWQKLKLVKSIITLIKQEGHEALNRSPE